MALDLPFVILHMLKWLCSSVGESPAQDTHLMAGAEDGGEFGIHQVFGGVNSQRPAGATQQPDSAPPRALISRLVFTQRTGLTEGAG